MNTLENAMGAGAIDMLFFQAGRRLSITVDTIVRDTITRAERVARKRARAKHVHSIAYSIRHNDCEFLSDLITLRII